MAKVDILIVEDDPFFAKKLQKDLSELGYSVLGIADNGKDAMAMFYSKDPDLLVMDIHIKGETDGIGIAKLIHNDQVNRKPIIFLTSDSTSDTFEEAKLLQPFAYMQKPVDKFTLQHQIELAIHYANKDPEKTMKEQFSSGVFQKDFFYIKKNKRIVKVYYKDILYAQVESNYTTLHTADENFTIISSLKDLTNKLPASDFMRIHKNYIVNLLAVNEFDFEEFLAHINNLSLPIGKKFKTKITQSLHIIR
ncbi:MAG: LytR/AlgR family response regulator transcription factor [Rhodothermaceae bacterium]